MLTVQGIGLLAALGAGLVSFLSPCVFPLVPGYLSYLAGTATQANGVQSSGLRRWYVATHALCFVAGFTIIFIMLGATASTIGQSLVHHLSLLRKIAGVAIILFGLTMTLAYMIQAPWLTWLYRERRMEVHLSGVSFWRSGLIGLAFGAGWTPCVGPLLGTILTLAAVDTTLAQGVLLLLVYAIGLGIPFLLAGVLIDRAASFVRLINRYTGPISIVGGLVMIVMGYLMFSGVLASLARLSPIFGSV